jgi:hypothetical protein
LRRNFKKYRSQYIFLSITLIYILSRWITFKGFNGTDDLHYAMLAANMLHGKYTPFASNDIFSGRILLIAFQALIYFIGGINVYTTQLGTMIVTMLSCYLTAFKLIENMSNNSIIITSALFYFNPVLSEANLGVMPDVYVMLAGIIVLLLWKKILKEQNQQKIILNSILIGLIIFAAMFFKENALIFIPFLFCIAFFNKKDHSLRAGLISILTFCFFIFLAGCMYYYFTGDFFFRVQQIKTAGYPHPCNYTVGSDLIIRLTYGVWKDFIVESFYPVILASIMIILRVAFDRSYHIMKDRWTVYFVILLLLALYFPFSLSGYQPLCFKARHFLFLLPLGVTISSSFLEDAWSKKHMFWLFIITSAILLVGCISGTGEKWYWMMYSFLFMYFVLQKLSPYNSLLYKLRYTLFAAILWVYMPYHLFFMNSNWFKNIQSLTKKLDSNFFYFPEHDNMMHWKLLYGFDSTFHSYNLEKEPFKVFIPYYEKLDTLHFHQGWFIVNKKYTTRSSDFLNRVDSLKQKKYFPKQISTGDVSAFFISNHSQLSYLKTIVAEDTQVLR